jgi:hypothetical protein
VDDKVELRHGHVIASMDFRKKVHSALETRIEAFFITWLGRIRTGNFTGSFAVLMKGKKKKKEEKKRRKKSNKNKRITVGNGGKPLYGEQRCNASVGHIVTYGNTTGVI